MYASGEAHSAAQFNRLTQFYRQAEEYGAAGIKQLEIWGHHTMALR